MNIWSKIVINPKEDKNTIPLVITIIYDTHIPIVVEIPIANVLENAYYNLSIIFLLKCLYDFECFQLSVKIIIKPTEFIKFK